MVYIDDIWLIIFTPKKKQLSHVSSSPGPCLATAPCISSSMGPLIPKPKTTEVIQMHPIVTHHYSSLDFIFFNEHIIPISGIFIFQTPFSAGGRPASTTWNFPWPFWAQRPWSFGHLGHPGTVEHRFSVFPCHCVWVWDSSNHWESDKLFLRGVIWTLSSLSL